MAVTDPTTPAAVVIPLPVLPDPAEPAQIAEAGVSTSEWKLAVAYLTQLAGTATAGAAAAAGFHFPTFIVQYAAQAEVLGAVLVAVYVLGRSIRKKGTSA